MRSEIMRFSIKVPIEHFLNIKFNAGFAHPSYTRMSEYVGIELGLLQHLYWQHINFYWQ
jgi:hypothetical protein